MTRLTDRLDAAADEMTGTDFAALQRRVDLTARRIGRHRTAFTILGVLAVTGALVAGGLQVLPRDTVPNPAVNPTSTATTEPGPSATPTATAPANAVPGTLVFLTLAPSTSGAVPLELTVIADGVSRTSSFGTTDFHESVRVVSPDLSKIAAVHTGQDYPFGHSGDLVIIEPGGSRRTVATDVEIGGPEQTPVWTPDSTRVLATNRDLEWRAIDVEGSRSPAVSPALGRGHARYPVWSDNGRYLAYGDDEGLHVVSSDGTGVRGSFAHSEWPAAACLPVVGCPASLSAVSDDGRYVAVGSRRTSPGPRNPPRLVLDLQAHQIVELPDVTGELSAVFFRPGGGMLLYAVDHRDQTSHCYLLGRDLQVVRTFPGPSRSMGELVAYIP